MDNPASSTTAQQPLNQADARNGTLNISRLKFPLLIAGVGLLLGLIGDLLLYDEPIGISVPILITATIIALIVLARLEGARLTFANLWLILPLLLLAVFSAIRAQPLVRTLDIVGALALLLLLANRLAAPPLINLSTFGYALALIESSIASLLMPFSLLPKAAAEARQHEGTGARSLRRVLVGLLLAIPFLCIFSLLFASADLVFRKGADRILESFSIADIFGHSFWIAILAWVACGWLAYALSRSPGEPVAVETTVPVTPAPTGEEPTAAEPPLPDAPASRRPTAMTLRGVIGALEASVALFSVDLLFLLFVGIQFAALFGREAFLRSQGLTYSEYARRGFFELLAVALLTLSLILVLDYITRRITPGEHLAFQLGSGLMIGMTVIILASAFVRLQLYEEAYGFTRLRVHSHVFMIWLAILLLAVLALLITARMRLFATTAFVVALSFVITLNILDPDAFIVRQNLARAARGEGVELDLDYLGSLSEDAVPQLTALFDRDESVQDALGPWLRRHLNMLDRRHEDAGWPSAHWSIYRAHRLLDSSRSRVEEYEPARALYYRESYYDD